MQENLITIALAPLHKKKVEFSFTKILVKVHTLLGEAYFYHLYIMVIEIKIGKNRKVLRFWNEHKFSSAPTKFNNCFCLKKSNQPSIGQMNFSGKGVSTYRLLIEVRSILRLGFSLR